jgi:hypothetical protein
MWGFKSVQDKIIKITRMNIIMVVVNVMIHLNCDCKNISVTKTWKLVLFDISIKSMDKLHYVINAIT